MIPLVGTRKELAILKALVERTASQVFAENGMTLDYLVGTMIELPRAALAAGQIAEEAAFFSFGTNDLTQTALGLSRDDAGRFLTQYVEKGIFARDPDTGAERWLRPGITNQEDRQEAEDHEQEERPGPQAPIVRFRNLAAR